MKLASWIAVVAGAGFAMSWLGSSVAGLNRDVLVPIYALVTAGLLRAYFQSGKIGFWKSLTRRWRSGVIGGLAVGLLLTLNVVAQPGGAEAAGVQLARPVLWLGIVYGVADALLLNVLPVWIVHGEWAGESKNLRDRLRRAGVALGASLLVAATYHLGYEEFQGRALMQPLIGNGLITLAFLLTGCPAASIIAHVIMHVAAGLHGINTTVQLPPHY